METTIDNRPCTPKQTWALFCGTKLDCRGLNLSITEASSLISRMKAGEDIRQELINAGARDNGKSKPTVNFQAIYDEAHAAGMEAGNNHNPRPMIVSGYENEPIMDGMCGFAWINFAGNTAWARWCTKNKFCRNDYPSGKAISVPYFNQSWERKYAYARAFAKILEKHGIKAYARERLD